jgi:hypothetical protein
LYATSIVAEQLAKSQQPLVPERVFVASGNGDGHANGSASGMLGLLMNLLVAEKSGFALAADNPELKSLREYADRMSQEALTAMQPLPTEPPALASKE